MDGQTESLRSLIADLWEIHEAGEMERFIHEYRHTASDPSERAYRNQQRLKHHADFAWRLGIDLGIDHQQARTLAGEVMELDLDREAARFVQKLRFDEWFNERVGQLDHQQRQRVAPPSVPTLAVMRVAGGGR